MKVLSIFGTRPEAIKMAPVVAQLRSDADIESAVCVTGQHQTMLKQVLSLFDIEPDYDLSLMQPNQTLNGLTSRMFGALDPVLESFKPDCVLVHGDTTTAMVAAVAAFHRRIAIGHVEAGLRTRDIRQPWPEEMNRCVVDVVSDFMFAPTEGSRINLGEERLHGKVFVTGNTVIDALMMTVKRIDSDAMLRAGLDAKLPQAVLGKKILLVTGHRRENFGEGFANICNALAQLSLRDDIQIIYPVHLNPNVREPVLSKLAGLKNVHLIEPLDYLLFVRLMQRAHIILTDSGGVQEEAPALGKPVLVMRDVTERPEAVVAGTVRLVGTESARIVSAINELYDADPAAGMFMHRQNPYGDGKASRRILCALKGMPFEEFTTRLSVTASELEADSPSVETSLI